MKKRINVTDEEHRREADETTGNKEDSHIMEGNRSFGDDIQPSEENYNTDAENISAGEVTDKVDGTLKATVEKLADFQDKYVRLSAEFDNYRKRTLREKMDMVKYSGEDILLKIIPFMDDFDRALSHMDVATDCSAMKNGIELIYSKFSDFLKQNGVKEIESVNSEFNVDLHEAVAKIPVTEKEKKGKVIDVIQKGYFLQDKVIRFSKVVVGE